MSHLNNAPDLTGLNGIPSTIPMNSMVAGQSVQQNASPIIFSKGVEVGKELSMSAAHSNIARLVTKNENGATGIADIVNKMQHGEPQPEAVPEADGITDAVQNQ